AQNKNYNHIVLPECHSPRAMLTWSLTQQFFILHHYGIISDHFKADIQKAINLLNENEALIKSEAHKIAELLYKRIGIIYASANFEGVAVRWRQQINENAKSLCWHHVVPEMNHNELVGWAGGSDNLAVIVLRNKGDFARNQTRMNISAEVIKRYTPHYYE
ncbi:MAG: bifunctional phosphoglucose/phosphomannose isomerase, partial [Phototrophicales bacterium]